MLRLLLTAVLLQLALSGSSTEVNVDFTESISQANLPLLERVVSTVDINYFFTLLSTNQWTQFNDFRHEFELEYAQYVKFTYTINIGSVGVCVLATRLMIDGKEERIFRSHLLYIQYHQRHRYGEVFLGKGKHHAEVEYRTSCYGQVQTPSHDWPANVFRVDYHRVKPTS